MTPVQRRERAQAREVARNFLRMTYETAERLADQLDPKRERRTDLVTALDRVAAAAKRQIDNDAARRKKP